MLPVLTHHHLPLACELGGMSDCAEHGPVFVLARAHVFSPFSRQKSTALGA